MGHATQMSGPDEDFTVVCGVADEYGQDDPGVGALQGWDLVDAAGVEEVEVARLQVHAAAGDPVFGRVVVEGALGDVGLDVLSPEAPMQDGLGAFALVGGVLEAENAGKLVLETGDGVVEALLAQGDVVDVGSVGVAGVMDAEDGGTVEAAVRLAGDFDGFADGEFGEGVVNGVYRVVEPVKEVTKEGVGIPRRASGRSLCRCPGCPDWCRCRCACGYFSEVVSAGSCMKPRWMNLRMRPAQRVGG